MAAATPELKARFKELGIVGGVWSDGKESFDVCKGGMFNLHSLKYTRFKDHLGKWKMHVQYRPTRCHYGKHGGYTNQYEYGQSLEKFNEVWEVFMLGYKEYQQAQQENDVSRDFND